MSRVVCSYCGLPFNTRRVEPERPVFCCTGCAMLSRVPVDEKGQFPVNAHLVSALAVGFLFFNQLLFWLLAVLLVREGKMIVAERIFWCTAGVGFAVWGAIAWLQWKEKAARTSDYIALALALAVAAIGFKRLPPEPLPMVLANLGLMIWTFRGLLRPRRR